jgi:Dynamin GTPase effector domain
MQEAMSKKSINDCQHGSVVRLEDVISHHPMSNIEHTVQDMHDILKSYYKVAWKLVVDVICMQAVGHHLISGPATPVKLFSPAFVGAMTSEQLEEIAGEDASQKRRRKQLEKEIDGLEKGKNILT